MIGFGFSDKPYRYDYRIFASTFWLIDPALVTLACSTFSPLLVFSGSLHTHAKDFLLGRFVG
jgi:hypothetical protein